MTIQRRAFLKLGVAAGITTYAEPMAFIARKRAWVEDRGDFYVVRVPDGKTFADEILDKPTIIQLGHRSIVSSICVRGFVNVVGGTDWVLQTSIIDVRLSSTTEPRMPIVLSDCRRGVIQNNLLDLRHEPERESLGLLPTAEQIRDSWFEKNPQFRYRFTY